MAAVYINIDLCPFPFHVFFDHHGHVIHIYQSPLHPSRVVFKFKFYFTFRFLDLWSECLYVCVRACNGSLFYVFSSQYQLCFSCLGSTGPYSPASHRLNTVNARRGDITHFGTYIYFVVVVLIFLFITVMQKKKVSRSSSSSAFCSLSLTSFFFPFSLYFVVVIGDHILVTMHLMFIHRFTLFLVVSAHFIVIHTESNCHTVFLWKGRGLSLISLR